MDVGHLVVMHVQYAVHVALLFPASPASPLLLPPPSPPSVPPEDEEVELLELDVELDVEPLELDEVVEPLLELVDVPASSSVHALTAMSPNAKHETATPKVRTLFVI